MIIIDGDNLARILFHAMLNATLTEAANYWIILGVLRIIDHEILPLRHGREQVIVVWDGKTAQWRRDIYPNYKKKTYDPHIPIKIYQEQRTLLKDNIFPLLGITQFYSEKHEADDLVAAACYSFDTDTLICSSDKDFYQLVSKNVSIFPLIRAKRKKQIRVTEETFQILTGWETPQQYLLAKCMLGDSSDCVKGVNGIGEKSAHKILDNCYSLGRLANLIKQSTDKKMCLLKDNWTSFLQNYTLMQLPNTQISGTQQKKELLQSFQPSCPDLQKLRVFLVKHKFFSAVDTAEWIYAKLNR